MRDIFHFVSWKIVIVIIYIGESKNKLYKNNLGFLQYLKSRMKKWIFNFNLQNILRKNNSNEKQVVLCNLDSNTWSLQLQQFFHFLALTKV